MKVLKKLACAAAMTAALASVGAQAATVELALVIDASGSISNGDYLLQRDAYVNALSDASVLARDGSVAIGVWQFGAGVQQVFATQIITGANIGSLIGALTGMNRASLNTSATHTGSAINTAALDLNGNGINFDRQVIDVSTDGVHNGGLNLTTAVNNALTGGIDQINCLGVGAGASCNFEAGVGAFEILATNFSVFEATLRTKLIRETGSVPLPGTALLAGLGLLGMSLVRRRAK